MTDPASRNDPHWLEEAVARHLGSIRAYVRMQMPPDLRQLESASDVMQSTIRGILTNPERVDYRDEPSFRRWLYIAVDYKVKEKLRHHNQARRDRNRVEALPQDSDLQDSYAGVLPDVVANEAAENIERAMDSLDDLSREVLARARILGETHAQIAEALDITETMSKTRLRRALTQLATRLARLEG